MCDMYLGSVNVNQLSFFAFIITYGYLFITIHIRAQIKMRKRRF